MPKPNSIEVDPREASPDTIAHLRQLGFNRLSLGVQDFDMVVQQAINRIQPFEMTASVMQAARDTGFHSIGVDLIYGLPHQTVASFSRTLDTMLELAPDRLSVFAYAHMPQLFKMQRQMDSATLPSPAQRFALLRRVVERLTDGGMCTSAWITSRCPPTNSHARRHSAACTEISRATTRGRNAT